MFVKDVALESLPLTDSCLKFGISLEADLKFVLVTAADDEED